MTAFKVKKFIITIEDSVDEKGFLVTTTAEPPIPEDIDELEITPSVSAFESILGHIRSEFETDLDARKAVH
ncbi:MAG: hypothetical protein JHC33_01175 [Ignisphaera sp.]|jgi:hypothetical protein|nr:hypothetical protein [Ignisphaera sp.]